VVIVTLGTIAGAVVVAVAIFGIVVLVRRYGKKTTHRFLAPDDLLQEIEGRERDSLERDQL